MRISDWSSDVCSSDLLSDSRGETGYRFNSPDALAYPALADAAGNGFAPMVHRVNTFSLSWSMPLTERIGLRLFDTYETGKLSDWHYFGLDQSLVTWNRVYLAAGPSNYSVKDRKSDVEGKSVSVRVNLG